MKVLCINDSGWRKRIRFWLFKYFSKKEGVGPKYMEECTVVGEEINEFGPAFIFSEYGQDKYPQVHFMPLSDIDGVEILNNKEKENA